jgi:hypothetical protein
VRVTFACEDALSGIELCTPPVDRAVELDGGTVTGTAFDRAGNVASTPFGPIHIDKTAPLVTFSGNQASYGILDELAITCEAHDELSGLASSTCEDITGPAHQWLGTTTRVATASDVAGNTASTSLTFTVQASFGDLCTLTQQFVDEPGRGHANSMCVHLRNAEKAVDKGKSPENSIRSYLHGVDVAEKGGYLTASEAGTLRAIAATMG